jgi:hypothetical protein
MHLNPTGWHRCLAAIFILIVSVLLLQGSSPAQITRKLPEKVPPKRTSQIQDGFGINSDMPRDPYLPWNRWWWTRMFDAGFKWIRIGQYENSSDRTSWDWIEQKRGVYASSLELEDTVDSLIDNGMNVQVQLLYGNQMYTARSGKLPDVSVPEPGSFHNDDRSTFSVFWPPVTPEQVAAFDKYVAWTVDHFKDRIHYWALWNEQDIGYWNPWGNAEQYGHLLTSFVDTVHKTPGAKVIYGGQADPIREFTRTALDACKCAAGIDVYAYHTYPGYGQNMNPETMDYGAYLNESPRALRNLVKNYPGIGPDIPFFDDEFNSIPSWIGSDESVQAKYVTRGLIYNHAAGVKTFVWLLTSGTDGNEFDDFGIIHGLTNHDYDFTPRPVFYALQNTNALFADTKFDSSIEISGEDVPALRRKSGFPFMSYGFRSKTGKAIVAYWMAAHSLPGASFPPFYSTFTLKGTGIEHPVLIDVVSGDIRPLEWKKGTTDTLEALPVTDSIMAIADAGYFDWPVLPEAPSSLNAVLAGTTVKLSWEVHGGNPRQVVVERRDDPATGRGTWQRIAELPSSASDYVDSTFKKGQAASYRVRAVNDGGESASSNTVRVPAS